MKTFYYLLVPADAQEDILKMVQQNAHPTRQTFQSRTDIETWGKSYKNLHTWTFFHQANTWSKY